MTTVRFGFALLLLALPLSGATALAQAQTVRAVTVAEGIRMGWALAFLPDGSMLVTERPGAIRVVSAKGIVGPPLGGVPKVAFGGQGGLLDLIVDREFAKNRMLYFCFSEAGDGGNSTALASAKLTPDARLLTDVRVIFRQQPKVESRHHFGCRIVEANDGTLFMTLGDRFSRMQDAQTLDTHHGKVIRIAKDGRAPPDNPFAGRSGARAEIWSLGHRNLQGATLDAAGRLWTHEHGPQGGDELNRTEAGKNYGWPVITYGENYGGGKIGDGITEKAGLEQPAKYWVPSIAPSGMAFLTSEKYGAAWRNNFFIGSLKFRYFARLPLEGDKVGAEQRVMDLGQRVRDVRQGPDGFLYVLTEDQRGRIVRLEPAQR
jgi:glucose/arabinose dehydrogenase